MKEPLKSDILFLISIVDKLAKPPELLFEGESADAPPFYVPDTNACADLDITLAKTIADRVKKQIEEAEENAS